MDINSMDPFSEMGMDGDFKLEGVDSMFNSLSGMMGMGETIKMVQDPVTGTMKVVSQDGMGGKMDILGDEGLHLQGDMSDEYFTGETQGWFPMLQKMQEKLMG